MTLLCKPRYRIVCDGLWVRTFVGSWTLVASTELATTWDDQNQAIEAAQRGPERIRCLGRVEEVPMTPAQQAATAVQGSTDWCVDVWLVGASSPVRLVFRDKVAAIACRDWALSLAVNTTNDEQLAVYTDHEGTEFSPIASQIAAVALSRR